LCKIACSIRKYYALPIDDTIEKLESSMPGAPGKASQSSMPGAPGKASKKTARPRPQKLAGRFRQEAAFSISVRMRRILKIFIRNDFFT